MSDQRLKAVESPSPAQSEGGSNGGNGGGLVWHRLTELERRVASLEADVKSINDTVIAINAKMDNLPSKDAVIEISTKMDNLASKTYVLTIFGITGGMALLTFFGAHRPEDCWQLNPPLAVSAHSARYCATPAVWWQRWPRTHNATPKTGFPEIWM